MVKADTGLIVVFDVVSGGGEHWMAGTFELAVRVEPRFVSVRGSVRLAQCRVETSPRGV